MPLFMPRRKKVAMSKCPHCTYQTMKLCNYQRHMRIHTGERPFKCYLCPKSFKENRHLKRHLVTHASEDGYLSGSAQPPVTAFSQYKTFSSSRKPTKVHKCTFCPYTSVYTTNLQKHMYTHTGERPFRCQCKADFCTFPVKWLQISDTMPLFMPQPRRKKVVMSKCPHCTYQTMKLCNYQRHMRIHTGERPFKCYLCPKSFKENRHLKRHLVTHASEDGYLSGSAQPPGEALQVLPLPEKLQGEPAPQETLGDNASEDGYVSGSAQPPRTAFSQYKTFSSSRKPTKVHKCTFCPYTSVYTTNLQKHMYTHTGERPFRFQVCGRSFAQKVTLQCHLNTHASEQSRNLDVKPM
ncbi:hypothetical protein JTE90_025114 [Oedothorax gibbosus]|uniref:C2H2-type domain-containing protein n=1 Tax=Oedothorax gibbosus TaxID=931172 RepID=A0AAV6U3C5_9ARAC|nr:hypothetical protein JTE90_025114 [Oedothorax gibbosus]